MMSGETRGGVSDEIRARDAQLATRDSRSWLRLTASLAVRGIVSPSLTRDLLRVAWRFRKRRWFIKPPFLPLPAGEYVKWRMYTAYGDEKAVPPVHDVIRYARWAARQR